MEHGRERAAAIPPQVNRLMKKRLSPAKLPLPKFATDREAAEYYERHSVAGLWDQLPEAKPAKLSAALMKKVRDRHARAKSPISLRLEPEQIAAAKHIAAMKSVAYQTQLRMWIAEGIRREAKRA
jgi:predicted DNA binding CopG/RHH family protein